MLVPLIIGALGTVSKNFAKCQEYLGIQDVGPVGDSAYSQKGFPSMSWGRELGNDDVVHPARIESCRESHNNNNSNTNNELMKEIEN